MATDDDILPPERAPRRRPVDNHFPALLRPIDGADGDPTNASPIPLWTGSVVTPDQLAAVIHALAKPGDLADLRNGLSDALVREIANVVAVALNLPAGPRPNRLGRPPEGPRLVARDRGDGADPVLYLYDGNVRRSTNFTRSEQEKADAVLKLHTLFKEAEVVGLVLPTQVTVDVVIAYWLTANQPVGTTTLPQANTYKTEKNSAEWLLAYFGGKRLVDLTPKAIKAFGRWRMSKPGRRVGRDGERLTSSDQTLRGHLVFLEQALNFWKAETNMNWTPSIKKPKRNTARVAWLRRGEAARALLGARGWLWDRETGGWQTHLVWDPLGREYFVDPVTGRLRSRRLGHGAMVLRPKVWRDWHGIVRRKNGVARALVIAYYSGSRSNAIRLLRWDRDGVHGYPDFVEKILYRSDVGWPQSTKKQGPMDMCARLEQHMLRWQARDREKGIKWIVHNAWGRVFSRQLDGAIKWAMENAAMNPMPVSEDDLRFIDVKGRIIEVTLHVYRHSFATMLLEMGISENEVAKQLDISLQALRGTYGHRVPGASTDVREAFEALRLPKYRGKFQG